MERIETLIKLPVDITQAFSEIEKPDGTLAIWDADHKVILEGIATLDLAEALCKMWENGSLIEIKPTDVSK